MGSAPLELVLGRGGWCDAGDFGQWGRWLAMTGMFVVAQRSTGARLRGHWELGRVVGDDGSLAACPARLETRGYKCRDEAGPLQMERPC